MEDYSTGSLSYKTKAENRNKGWMFSFERHQGDVTLIPCNHIV